MSNVFTEASQLTEGSIRRADEIDYAASGDRLGPVIKAALEEHPEPFSVVRAATKARLSELGGVSNDKLGLFILACDMATAADVAEGLGPDDRHQLRCVWEDLLSS